MATKKPVAKAATYMTLAELDKAIETIKRAGARFDSMVQAAGLSALNHLAKHGDIGPVNRLMLAMPKGSRKSSLSQWLLNWGSLMLNTDADTKAEKPYVYSKKGKTDLIGAAEQHWSDAQKPRDISDVFDIQKALAQLIKKAKHAGSVTDPTLLSALEAIAPVAVQVAAGAVDASPSPVEGEQAE